MNVPNDERKSSLFARRYQTGLRRYLAHGSAATLAPAAGLGRAAAALGVETLDLAPIHERALLDQVLALDTATARDALVKRAGLFFAAAILPLEEKHRTALKANARLRQLNRALSQRTQELSASNRELKKEIAKRMVVEQSLRQSEAHATQVLGRSRQLQEQLRLLSRHVLSSQEEERKRISRELHDVIAEMLTGINVRLATLKLEAATHANGLGRKIAGTQRLIEASVSIVHRFARELRPAMLDDLGLIPALHTFMKSFSKQAGIRVSLTAFAGVEQLSSAKRTALYRVAQEALTNVARHANASRVDVRIQRLPHGLCMEIQDDGKAFNVEQTRRNAGKRQGLGLLGMQERLEMVGGAFAVESAPGKGTLIQAQIPFSKKTKDRACP